MGALRLALWGGAGLWLTTGAAWFLLAKAPVSLRSRMIAQGAGITLLASGAQLIPDLHAFRNSDLAVMAFLLLLSLPLLLGREWWLVRADAAAVEERIATGCSGLLIDWKRLPGPEVQLTVRNVESLIRLRPMGRRLTWVALPRLPGRGKVMLLVNWLAKQYPAPWPRLRIQLPGGQR